MPTAKKEQVEAFKKAALEIGTDEADDALDRIMGKLDLKKKPEPVKDHSTQNDE